MKIHEVAKRVPLLVFILVLMGSFLFGIIAGCSLGSKTSDSEEEPLEAIPENDGGESITYEPIQGKILASIQDNYTEAGIDITSIELSSGGSDLVRIELEYPGHSLNQRLLAGWHLLKDNFPRLNGYTTIVRGVAYHAEPDELEYAFSQGYTFDCGEEDADRFYELITKGIPSDVTETTVESE